MTQCEMTEKFSERMHMTQEEARTALEAGDWNMLTAAHLLEQEKIRRIQEMEEVSAACEAGTAQAAAQEQPETAESADRAENRRRGHVLGNLGGHIRRLVACGNRNHLVVRRGEAAILELPLTAVVALLLCAFWVCVPLLVVGLFAGCRYSFRGQDLNRESFNRALDKVADAAERLKETAARA